MKTRVGIVVVVYHPQPDVLKNMAAVASDVGCVWVIDNTPQSDPSFKEAAESIPHTIYLSMEGNGGIGKALNRAADVAIESGYSFLLTMDQDSIAPEGMVRQLIAMAEEDPSIGIVGPFHLDRNAPDPLPNTAQQDVTTLMTSGSLINLEAHTVIGGFRDDYFIDYVDDEYCLRMQSRGYRVVRANRVILEHAQGEKTTKTFFGRTVHPTHHAPERFYYQSRNRIALRRDHGIRFPEYFAYERSLHMGRLAKMVLYEHDRIQKLRMVLLGMVDGWRGNMGPLHRG